MLGGRGVGGGMGLQSEQEGRVLFLSCPTEMY